MNSSIAALLKRFVPIVVKSRIKTSPFLVRYRSSSVNVYHCTVYRTGSQWMRRILADRRVCRYSGLLYEMHFQRIFGTAARPDRTVTYEVFPYVEPFRKGLIVGLYAGYEHYARIPKPENHKTFFVSRDPRDIVVSHYFASRRDAQNLNSPHYRILAQPEDGIPWMIDRLEEMGLFSALGSWASIPQDDPRVLLLRFEDLIGPRQFEVFKALFAHCDIAMPDDVLRGLLADHSFAVLSSGRQPGEEDVVSHYRKGVVGDWKNHFTTAHVEKFKAVTNDLVALTGYKW